MGNNNITDFLEVELKEGHTKVVEIVVKESFEDKKDRPKRGAAKLIFTDASGERLNDHKLIIYKLDEESEPERSNGIIYDIENGIVELEKVGAEKFYYEIVPNQYLGSIESSTNSDAPSQKSPDEDVIASDKQVNIASKQEILDNIVQINGFDYYSEISGCKLEFPANSWSNARNSKNEKRRTETIEDMLNKVDDRGFDLINGLVKEFDLTRIRFSSLYRADRIKNQVSPHMFGRGIDMTVFRTIEDNVVFLRSKADDPEPNLSKSTREWMWENKDVYELSQIIGPWKIVLGIKDEWKDNNMNTKLEKSHLNHLHITIRRK